MRIIPGFLIVAIVSFGLAPSSPEFHNRYGLSDLERFTVRPGITATVQYGEDHLACQIKIEPYQPVIHPYEPMPSMRLMSSEEVAEILEEIVPRATRGKEISNGGFQASCGAVNVNEFENVLIVRGESACTATNLVRDTSTQIVFKRDICPKVEGLHLPHIERVPSNR
jgi:hypothetical protein